MISLLGMKYLQHVEIAKNLGCKWLQKIKFQNARNLEERYLMLVELLLHLFLVLFCSITLRTLQNS